MMLLEYLIHDVLCILDDCTYVGLTSRIVSIIKLLTILPLVILLYARLVFSNGFVHFQFGIMIVK